MNWKKVIKDRAKQPAGNDYSAWKEIIAAECYHQCVYCSIHEIPWGGIDNFHIEHYRPKSKFAELALDICNLFYACPICNRFKSDDWPGEPLPDLSTPSYPNPSEHDFTEHFDYDTSTSLLSGRNVAANYVLQRLYLNRPQLIYERREAVLSLLETRLRKELAELFERTDDAELLRLAMQIFDRLLNLKQARNQIRPYALQDIRR